MIPVRDDLDEADFAALEHQFPGLSARLTTAARLSNEGQHHKVPLPHAVPGQAEAVDSSADGVQRLHPAFGTGATSAPTGCN